MPHLPLPAACWRRYQGRLTWKGRTNIRNPAIAVALELLLESRGMAREGGVVSEPAPPLAVPLPLPLALPVRLAPAVPSAELGAWAQPLGASFCQCCWAGLPRLWQGICMGHIPDAVYPFAVSFHPF